VSAPLLFGLVRGHLIWARSTVELSDLGERLERHVCLREIVYFGLYTSCSRFVVNLNGTGSREAGILARTASETEEHVVHEAKTIT
jgi:hypothetical protein